MMKIKHFDLLMTAAFSVAVLVCVSCGKPASAGKSAASSSCRIEVKTDPDGASVFCRGVKLMDSTPQTVELPEAGVKILRIEKDGFVPQWIRVETAKNDTARVETTLEPLTASVLVTSTPSGAMVTVDGKEKGPTPYILSNLKFGTYDVSVALNNYKSDSRELTVPMERSMPDSPFEFHFDLVDETGSVKLTTEPEGADIFVDDEQVASRTPALLQRLKEGAHKVRFVKKGFDPVEVTVSVERGKQIEQKTVVLSARSGSLALAVTPQNAAVQIDSGDVNDWSKPLTLSPGQHQIVVSKNGYDTETRTFTINSEETLQQNIVLTRNTGEVRFLVNPPGVAITLDGKFIGMSQPEKGKPEIAHEFRIAGLSMGKHRLQFSHPRAAKMETKDFTISKKGESVMLPKSELWIPNVNLTVLSTKYIHPGRVLPTAADSDEIIYEPEPSVRNTYKKSEVRIEYLPKEDFSDPRYQTSFVDLTGDLAEAPAENNAPAQAQTAEQTEESAEDEKTEEQPQAVGASIRFESLPAGSEVIIDGKSCGKASANMPFEVKNLKPGPHSLKISHKHGKNTKKPGSNTVEFKKPVELEDGECRTISAPPILWVADHEFFLKDGTRYPTCRILSEDGNTVTLETAPGKTVKVKRSEIAKKKQLKD